MVSILPPPHLFSRLRSETSGQHKKLEEKINPLLSFRDRNFYQRYLERSLPLYRSLEESLGRFDWPALGFDFEARRKSKLLEKDLQYLDSPSVRHPISGPPSSTLDVPESIGCLYVLEGATLGGQFITRHLESLGIQPETGGSFFFGYGDRTGEMWKTFQAWALQYCRSEEDTLGAIWGAQHTFGLFSDWLEEGLLPNRKTE